MKLFAKFDIAITVCFKFQGYLSHTSLCLLGFRDSTKYFFGGICKSLYNRMMKSALKNVLGLGIV